MERYRPNMRDVILWLSEASMNIPVRTIQHCRWRTECMPRSWAMDLAHVGLDGLAAVGNSVNAALPIDLDEDIGDVGLMNARLSLGPSAMPAAAFVAIDDDRPTCAEPGEDPLALEHAAGYSYASWEAPTAMQVVYDDDNPESREARRCAQAASEMLVGYARATDITLRNPSARGLASVAITPATTPRRRGRILPAWMYAPAPSRQQLIDSGVSAVMIGHVDAAKWMIL
ncbi:unnamed protein product [Closterium sp. NIES-64]|nr:unnamed protein product [Closterium sp. NIES-64]